MELTILSHFPRTKYFVVYKKKVEKYKNYLTAVQREGSRPAEKNLVISFESLRGI